MKNEDGSNEPILNIGTTKVHNEDFFMLYVSSESSDLPLHRCAKGHEQYGGRPGIFVSATGKKEKTGPMCIRCVFENLAEKFPTRAVPIPFDQA